MVELPKLISDEELGLEPSQPVFLSLAAELLGNAGHESDGFEQAFSETVTLLEGADAALALLDTDHLEISGVAALVDPSSLDVDVLAFQADLATGNQILNDLGDLLAPAQPAPTTPAAPPTAPPPGVRVSPSSVQAVLVRQALDGFIRQFHRF